jgi:hypothetical protein
MSPLTVPVPTVTLDPPGGPAELETPVPVALGPVLCADGSPVTMNDVRKLGVLLYRVAVAGGPDEIWNDAAKTWQAPPADPGSLAPVPLLFKDGAPQPWQGTLVAIGQKDAGGRERIAAASGGVPRYRLRAVAEAARADGAHAGLGPFSPEWLFAKAADKMRFAVTFDTPDTTAKQATVARLQLKSAALSPAGYVEIRAAGANAVEIAGCDAGGTPLATIVLTPAGEIRLRPAAGQRVVVDGDLETETILYRPSGGGPKHLLA